MNTAATAEAGSTVTPMQPAGAPRQHKTSRVPVAPLKAFMAKHDVTASEMSRAFYLHDTTVSQWLAEGTMPQGTLLQIECLERRRSGANAVLVVKPGPRLAEVLAILKALGVEAVELVP